MIVLDSALGASVIETILLVFSYTTGRHLARLEKRAMVKIQLSILAAVLLATGYLPLGVNADEAGALLSKYCFHCHGGEVQKADRKFHDLPDQIKTLEHLERYQEIVDQLNLESMPPNDSAQPSDKERAEAIAQLTRRIAEAQALLGGSGQHSILRRLNSWEYRQTISDLLGINVDVWDPAEDFPEEVKVEGFDNNGAELVTSGILLDHYLVAAEEAIRRATHFGERPRTLKYSQKSPFYFEGNAAKGLPKLFQTGRFRWVPETPYTDLYGRHYRGGHIGFIPLFKQGGAPHSGLYTIRVKAAALGRVHEYGKAIDDFQNGDPLVMEIAAVDRRGSVTSSGSVSDMASLALIELTNEDPEWFEWKVYLDKGYEPEVRFRNGPIAAKRMVRMLTTHAADKPEFLPFVDMPDKLKRARGVLNAYKGPRLRIWEIQVEGPHFETWPPTGHRALYGNSEVKRLRSDSIRSRLEEFAEKAFRRPVAKDELEPIHELVERKVQDGVEPLEALQLGLQAILCSPGFLYLNLGEGDLSQTAVASRLSYFLWSSPPDEPLLKLANEGMLVRQLSAQVDRMLTDSRSDHFVQHFVRSWLDIDNIGTMPPGEDFLVFYRDNLEQAMRAETQQFFRHILDNNLPIKEFLDADYTFLNRELARHYGLRGVVGNEMQRVSLTGTERRGLLGQGAFLTASANGVDTSPVVRGIYVLEKLLGYTPPPPPPDVPIIEPDIRGAKTIREQLERHREIASCAECHRKIDPLGFALENYDAIGGWRKRYPGNLPIDPSGKLPNGDVFDSITEFRAHLMQREDQFTRCLAEKLMTYALGRKLEIADRPGVDKILEQLANEKGGLRDLIQLIVLSDAFQSN